MSSLVQRQPERQGIFLIALSPLERGAGGVNISLNLYPPPPENSSPSISSLPKDLGRGWGGFHIQTN